MTSTDLPQKSDTAGPETIYIMPDSEEAQRGAAQLREPQIRNGLSQRMRMVAAGIEHEMWLEDLPEWM
jgi:hypothetical protein